MIYLPRRGGSLLCIATPCCLLPPKITKQTIHLLPTGQFPAASLFSRVWVGVVIIKLKAYLSSTGTGLANWNKELYVYSVNLKDLKMKRTTVIIV